MSADWRVDIEMPDDGWIDVPGPEESVAGWADEVCADLYVTGPTAVALAEQLRTFGADSRTRASDVMLLWVPQPSAGVLATLTLDAFGPGELRIGRLRPEPLDLDGVQQAEAAHQDPSLAPVRLGTVQLAAGPAVVCQRMEQQDAATGAGTIFASAAYTILPRPPVGGGSVPEAVRVVVSWWMVQESDEFAALAADCARGVVITPGR